MRGVTQTTWRMHVPTRQPCRLRIRTSGLSLVCVNRLITSYLVADRVVGEWMAAENDCAYWLNGFGKGARYDGSFPGSYFIGSCVNENTISAMSSGKLAEVAQYISAQLDAYEAASGWFFWAGKTESAELW